MDIVDALAGLRDMVAERDRCGDRSRLGPMDKAIAEQRAMIAAMQTTPVVVHADYADAPLIVVAVPGTPAEHQATSDALRRRVRLSGVWARPEDEEPF